MSTKNDQRGFVFSLDASLSVLVILVVLAGAVRMAGPELVYEQHGYLRLERYANDALRAMELTGVMDNIVALVKHGDNAAAEVLARAELRKILPAEVQFRFVVGHEADPRLVVYPSDAEERANWEAAWRDATEVAIATRMSTLPPRRRPYRVLAWLDDDEDQAFMDEIERCTGWEVTRTSSEGRFRKEILRWDTEVVPNQRYYNAIFIPDAQEDFDASTERNLVMFSLYMGRLVVGGDTLWYNSPPDTWWFYEVLGVDYRYIGRPPLDNRHTGMHIIDDNHPITASPYYVSYRVDYAGENYRLYVYRPPLLVSTQVLAQWDNGNTTGVDPLPWRGIIFRQQYVGGELGRVGIGVLFNMRLAQSAMGANVGKDDWVMLARRAIGGDVAAWEFEPVTLHVWRGPEVD